MTKHWQSTNWSLRVNSFQLKLFQAALVSLATCLLTVTVKAMNTENVYESFVTVTAAHIPESNFIGMRKVYEDSEKDIAVYVNLDYIPRLPKEGEHVSSPCGITGFVDSTDSCGFFVRQDVQKAAPGDSGSKVYSESGDYLGFVSYLDSEGLVYCVAY